MVAIWNPFWLEPRISWSLALFYHKVGLEKMGSYSICHCEPRCSKAKAGEAIQYNKGGAALTRSKLTGLLRHRCAIPRNDNINSFTRHYTICYNRRMKKHLLILSALFAMTAGGGI
jgi:hypothetical protein